MNQQKIALTGRLRVGKDHVANNCAGTVIGFADPIYILCEHLTGYDSTHKDKIPGLRYMYQRIGQWGRGEITEEYPLTIERGLFAAWIKSGEARKLIPWVSWDMWGSGGDIWIDALLRRAEEEVANRIFVTNCRFKLEYDTFLAEKWDHWHVMCSATTYEERLREVGLTIQDPKIKDVSEQLAGALDRAVVAEIKQNQVGPKLKVIWNDHRPSPCERLQTLAEFQAYLQNQEVEPEYTYHEQNNPVEQGPEGGGDSAPDSGDGGGDVEKYQAPRRAPKQSRRNPAERRRSRKSKGSR